MKIEDLDFHVGHLVAHIAEFRAKFGRDAVRVRRWGLVLDAMDAGRTHPHPDDQRAVCPELAARVMEAERAAVAAYVRDRARWLRAEVDAGGSGTLRAEAGICDYIAGQIAAGRRAGSHPR